MQFGIREVCDVFVKAKTTGKVGNLDVVAGQPVCHFDSLKTSTVEGASTTVYAQGGKGNPRLMAWEGERTLTFTMEDALISKTGIALLTGAGLITTKGADGTKVLKKHVTVTGTASSASAMKLDDADITLIYDDTTGTMADVSDYPIYISLLDVNGDATEFVKGETVDGKNFTGIFVNGGKYLVDGYTEVGTGEELSQIDIEPDKFGGNYYFEGSTLFKNKDGKDLPAEFIIPNGKIQSNFTFTMASSGDPSTFTYTVDAFPGPTKNDPSKKVLASIQILETTADTSIKDYPNDIG